MSAYERCMKYGFVTAVDLGTWCNQCFISPMTDQEKRLEALSSFKNMTMDYDTCVLAASIDATNNTVVSLINPKIHEYIISINIFLNTVESTGLIYDTNLKAFSRALIWVLKNVNNMPDLETVKNYYDAFPKCGDSGMPEWWDEEDDDDDHSVDFKMLKIKLSDRRKSLKSK